MDNTINDVLEFVKENDVKFVRLAFCDIFGKVKNISIMSSELPRAFEKGISFDASAVKGFMNVEESDLLLFPVASTIQVLPWRPQQGRVARFYCNIKRPDLTDFEGDSRALLKKAVDYACEEGFNVQVGTECEFYLFQADENGNPTKNPQDYAGYCDIAPLDKGENVRREICLTLEQMGIMPESSHHESGPGQNEIDFKYSSALEAADNLVTFKTVVKSVAARNGLYASFMPLPIKETSGSGLHINTSLYQNGKNIFKSDDSHNIYAEYFISGILNRVKEITAFANPIINSYERFGKGEAPKYISWSHQNRSQLIRIPAATGEYSRMELRSPDPVCNPYIVLSLLIYAGIDGIKDKCALPEAKNINFYNATSSQLKGIDTLPYTLNEALDNIENSQFIAKYLPEKILNVFLSEKRCECEEYAGCSDKNTFETDKYFTKF